MRGGNLHQQAEKSGLSLTVVVPKLSTDGMPSDEGRNRRRSALIRLRWRGASLNDARYSGHPLGLQVGL